MPSSGLAFLSPGVAPVTQSEQLSPLLFASLVFTFSLLFFSLLFSFCSQTAFSPLLFLALLLPALICSYTTARLHKKRKCRSFLRMEAGASEAALLHGTFAGQTQVEAPGRSAGVAPKKPRFWPRFNQSPGTKGPMSATRRGEPCHSFLVPFGGVYF